MDFGYLMPETSNTPNESIKRPLMTEPITIGFVGRISPEKGIAVIIEAIALIQSEFGRKCKLLLLGHGEPSTVEHLANLASNAQVVFDFKGFKEHPYEYMHGEVDVVVVPSLWEEPFGRVAYEASKNGFPVVVSEIGGLQEAAALSGNPYLTFKSGNATSLANSIIKILGGETQVSLQIDKDRTLQKLLVNRISTILNQTNSSTQ